MKKSVLSVMLLAACAVFAFVGCSPKQEAAVEPEGLNIAIITSPSGVDDGSFNENNYDGCVAFVEENEGASVTPLREPSGDVAKIMKLCADVVADYDVEVCPPPPPPRLPVRRNLHTRYGQPGDQVHLGRCVSFRSE